MPLNGLPSYGILLYALMLLPCRQLWYASGPMVQERTGGMLESTGCVPGIGSATWPSELSMRAGSTHAQELSRY